MKKQEKEKLEKMIDSSDLRKSKEIKLNYMNFSDKEKVSLILKGDEHFGSKYFDKKEHNDWMKWIEKNDCYIIGMGDNLETATKDSVGAGIYEQDFFLDEQVEKWVEMNKKIAEQGKLMGLHRGNHEERIYKHSGLDITRMMCNMLGVKNFGVGTIHYIKVGNQSYSMYTTHGHSGARLPHTKIKACIDLSNMVDVDIYGMGHTHQLSHHVRQFYRPNKRAKTLTETTKHFVLTGSFLTHWGSYAHEAGYEMMRKGAVRIKLHGEKSLIKVSLG